MRGGVFNKALTCLRRKRLVHFNGSVFGTTLCCVSVCDFGILSRCLPANLVMYSSEKYGRTLNLDRLWQFRQMKSTI